MRQQRALRRGELGTHRARKQRDIQGRGSRALPSSPLRGAPASSRPSPGATDAEAEARGLERLFTSRGRHRLPHPPGPKGREPRARTSCARSPPSRPGDAEPGLAAQGPRKPAPRAPRAPRTLAAGSADLPGVGAAGARRGSPARRPGRGRARRPAARRGPAARAPAAPRPGPAAAARRSRTPPRRGPSGALRPRPGRIPPAGRHRSGPPPGAPSPPGRRRRSRSPKPGRARGAARSPDFPAWVVSFPGLLPRVWRRLSRREEPGSSAQNFEPPPPQPCLRTEHARREPFSSRRSFGRALGFPGPPDFSGEGCPSAEEGVAWRSLLGAYSPPSVQSEDLQLSQQT